MISNIHAFATMMAPRPKAAETDHIKPPVVMPDANASPDPLPEVIDVPAMARVAGPGLAAASSAANRMRGRLMSIGIAIWPFTGFVPAFRISAVSSIRLCDQPFDCVLEPAPCRVGRLVVV
jgi:hypothetical protein